VENKKAEIIFSGENYEKYNEMRCKRDAAKTALLVCDIEHAIIEGGR